jgi:hypothetical protein
VHFIDATPQYSRQATHGLVELQERHGQVTINDDEEDPTEITNKRPETIQIVFVSVDDLQRQVPHGVMGFGRPSEVTQRPEGC